jgi:hypothetical protein
MKFEGYEELKNMNKGQLLDLLKDCVYPNRTRGSIKNETETKVVQRKVNGQWVDYELTSYYCKELSGTDMSSYRPIIGDTEYTWGELKRHPTPLLRVMVYEYLRPKNIGEEE